ncbi:hypothetical protein NMG60_11026878 [Bertholletia excelsa]
MSKAIGIRILGKLLTQLKYMVVAALTRLRLFKSSEEDPEETRYGSTGHTKNYVLMWDDLSPSLVPVPVPVSAITTTLKKRLPVIEFADFLERGIDEQDDNTDEQDGEACCAACWDRIEGSHKIRELCNCRHVFHLQCLDRWVDEGQVTCPLCRSMLLPPNISPWMLLRIACLPPQLQEEELEDPITATTSSS